MNLCFISVTRVNMLRRKLWDAEGFQNDPFEPDLFSANFDGWASRAIDPRYNDRTATFLKPAHIRNECIVIFEDTLPDLPG